VGPRSSDRGNPRATLNRVSSQTWHGEKSLNASTTKPATQQMRGYRSYVPTNLMAQRGLICRWYGERASTGDLSQCRTAISCKRVASTSRRHQEVVDKGFEHTPTTVSASYHIAECVYSSLVTKYRRPRPVPRFCHTFLGSEYLN